ncbi:MAG: hypothetical protein P4L34_02150 [Paludibacter sp.]|nr:hypothetical protein [Paludibacter sp.]
MRKSYILLAGALLCALVANSQSITLYDGESINPSFFSIGGNPPNGASCPANAGWTLNVTGKMDILTEGLPNPFPTGLNTTEKVVRDVRAKDGAGWAGAALDITSLAINLNQINKFSVLVYKEVAGNVTMKIQGGIGSQQETAYYDTPGQWKRMDFTFDPTQSSSPTQLLVMPHDQTDLTETIVTYWDEVTMYDASGNPTVIYNGNDPVSGFFLDGYPGPNGSLNNLETDIFPNLNKTGINTSNHVLRFLRAKDGQSECGFGLGGLDVNVSTSSIFTAMIYKTVAGKVGMKLDGAGSQEVYADYSTPGEWAKLTFIFDPNQFTGNPTTLLIYPHFEATDLVNLPDNLAMYIDNITMEDTPTSVSNTEQNSAPVSYKIYSISGDYISNNVSLLKNGIYVKKSLLENGKTVNSKLIITNKSLS